jgi:DNA-binding beta-propeller fold protein YncE
MSARRPMLALALALAVVALSGDPAFAKRVRGPNIIGVIGKGEEGHTGGSGNGELAGSSGVAIDQATGDVYVVDSGNNRVEEFEASGAYLSQFGGGATPEGSFSGPTAVAVDQQTGDVYVVDTGHNVVDEFTANGAYLCELSGVGRGCQAHPTEPSTFAVPIGVAVDPTTGNPSSGDVYVSDKEHKIVDVFTRLGADVSQFMPGAKPWSLAVDAAGDVFVALAGEGTVTEYTADGGALVGRFEGAEQARTVSVDLQSGDIFVGEEPGSGYQIAEFEPSGPRLATFGSGLMSALGLASPGIAVNSATHVVYAADTAGNVVDMFGLVTIPDPTGCKASAVGTTSATLRGEVNPDGTRAESLFQYGTEKSYGLETPLALVGGGAEVEHNVPVEAGVTELTPGTTYHCRLDTTNATHLFNEGSDGTFETLPLLPIVDESPPVATEITSEGAIFKGVVNPDYGATVYHFVYGPEAGRYTEALPDIGIGKGFEPVAVEQATPPGALPPHTTVHFALIASNRAGTTVGADQTFTTAGIGNPPETAPVLSTGPAESIALTSAILTARVYPEGTPTMYLFEVGTTPAYGTVLFGGEAGRGGGAVEVTQALTNLQPGTTVFYRAVAFNAAGTTVGAGRAFTTPSSPSPIVQPATPALIPIPVFPVVKIPLPKHHKPKKKKHPKRKLKGHRARARAGVRPRAGRRG